MYILYYNIGEESLELLTKAFLRGFLFIVGDSVTTGQQNTTIWGGIHQKTNTTGGTARHGYPDPQYFNRLKQECGARGLFTTAHEVAAKKSLEDAAAKRKKEEEEEKKNDNNNNNNKNNSSSSSEFQTMPSNSDNGNVSMSDSNKKPKMEENSNNSIIASFVPHKDDDQLDQMISQLSTDLQNAMQSRNTTLIRQLMTRRNECSKRKKIVEEYTAAISKK